MFMSQTWSQPTTPLEASLPGMNGPRVLDATRRFARLLWIEFRRCGGYWMIPLILPLVWYWVRIAGTLESCSGSA